MKTFSQENNSFTTSLFIVYLLVLLTEFCVLALQINRISSVPLGIRIVQILFPVTFLIFFSLSVYYNNKTISLLLILSFQIICSLGLWSYYYFVTNQPLGFDANDALVYQQALDKSFGGTWKELIDVLKMEPRTASLSDWGYPTYRFIIYKLFPDSINGILALVIINCVVHTISSFYVYKISLRFLNNFLSIIVMSLWGLSATSVHVNTCGLKETVFSFFVVLAVYHMVEIRYRHKSFHFVLFALNTSFIWFFRNYVSIFLILVFIGCYPLRKLFYKWMFFFVVGIFFVAFFGTDILAVLLPPLKFVKISRDIRLNTFFGSNGIVANIMNFCFAWVAPIPRFNSSAEIKQVVFSGYSIFSAFFSLFGFYGLYKIIKDKKTMFYPLSTLLICNIVLIIVTCNSLDFRFQHPTSFIYDIFIVLGFSEIQKKGVKINARKTYTLSSIATCIFAFIYLLVIVYNR